MAKRLSKQNIEEIVKLFIEGKTIENLAINFECTNLTITKHLKKNILENQFKEIINKNKLLSKKLKKKDINKDFIGENTLENINNKRDNLNKVTSKNKEEDSFLQSPFIEIAPLNFEIDNSNRKDFTSIPISKVNFPKIVYMIVDKKIELNIKYLRDYPNWEFLSQDELNRKTIEIYVDLKNAKRFCNKEQKVIKVPNTNVFKLVSPILLSKGISRIISEDKLISL